MESLIHANKGKLFNEIVTACERYFAEKGLDMKKQIIEKDFHVCEILKAIA